MAIEMRVMYENGGLWCISMRLLAELLGGAATGWFPSHTTLASRERAMELELSIACSSGLCSRAEASDVTAGCRVNLGWWTSRAGE